MTITVILCTYNRCHSLARTLDSIANSTLPESVAWEVLVVDNNSTDQTRDVVAEISSRIPGRFRYVFEPTQGKSYALNTGIREARGELLAFTDDDVMVAPEWLENLTSALHDSQWAGATGRILLEWKRTPPRWLTTKGPYRMPWVLVGFDLGDDACDLTFTVGANMAFRKEVFEKYGFFRTDMGPTTECDIRQWRDARCPRSCEDIELGRRLIAGGERLLYRPNAVVYHPVPEDRVKKEYFLAWHFDYGRGLIRASEVPGARRWLEVPQYLFGKLTKLAKKTIRWIIALQADQRIFYKAAVWQLVGEIVEICRGLSPASRSAGESR
jgi:glucosyl-dolichyl phosphate glucuronosyltransferase